MVDVSATISTCTFAVAFRQTGGGAPDWRHRIEQWLAAHEHEIEGSRS